MKGKEILEYFNYSHFEYCNEPLHSCPGKFECWNFDHHIIELKNFIASRRIYWYTNSVCPECFIIMYIDLARIVYVTRTALNETFLRKAYHLYLDLYDSFLDSRNTARPFRSHFFYIIFDEVSKFIKRYHSNVQYAYAVEVNVLYYNILDCWMKCSANKRCYEHNV